MDTPGSEISSDISDSPGDSSSADSTPAQIAHSTQAIHRQSPIRANNSAMDEDESESDVSMSAETDDDEKEDPIPSTMQVNPVGQKMEQPTPTTNAPTEPSNKRKYEDTTSDTTNDHVTNGAAEEVRKRLKPLDGKQSLETTESTLRQDKSLPAEIWHRIFTFIPPRTLGLLLRVNRCFNAYLDPSSSKPSPAPLSNSAAKLLKADAIWKASRVLFRPGMPAPLTGKSELDMWKLASSLTCQFCSKKQHSNAPPIDQWHPGPGENGNVPLWSFGIRTCGICLRDRSVKEIDLLLSSSFPSVLMPALPFVLFTNELHILSATMLQNGAPPSTLQITKHFFQRQIEDLKTEFTQVQSMGAATAEEWIKGLDERSKEWRNDAGRWEKWEANGGIARMRSIEQYRGVTSAAHTRTATPSTTASMFSHVPHSTNGHSSIFQSNTTTGQTLSQFHQLPQPIQTSFPTKPPARFDSPAQNGFGTHSRYPPPRQERTKEEVAELKAARRAGIERRCMELDPPLTAGVLAHMGSFQAAIQIIQPLDDSAWEVLKPRLLSQRQDAEQRENDRLAQFRVVQEHLDDPNRHQNVKFEPELKDFLERDWDDVQAPLRARLGGYADEIIRDGWNDGEKVTLDNCSTFAAEVLIYVRKRFYAEVAKDEAAVRATGRETETDPPYGPYTRKLILENMKWVFDTKIKPHTEEYRKELFLCNDCGSQSKYYGFEGVIQHYAAKHTNALSSGSIVVHWKAEWPENPPFDPEPANAASKNTYYATAPSGSAAPYPTSGPQTNYGYGGYQPTPVSAPMQVPNPHLYQESPGPYYGHPQFGEPYSGHQNGPYAPPQTYTDNSGGYPAQFSAPPSVGGVAGYNDPPVDYSQQGFGGPYPASTQRMYTSPHPGPLYPAMIPEATQQQQSHPQHGGQYGYPYSQPGPTPAPPTRHFTPPPLKTEEYKSQLQDVARNARAVWDSINNLKDVQGSVKVYTIVYHILQRSRAKFEEDPPLTMIVDGLNNNKDMRKVRNINGLRCKACSLGLPGSSSAFAKKLLSFPQLASHFLKDHEQASRKVHGRAPDWRKDMIKLPDFTQNNPIANSRGMDDKKLKLIAEALPEIFIAKSTQNDHVDRVGPQRSYMEAADQAPYDLAPSLDNHEKYYTAVDSGKPSEADSVTHDSGQYDPRYPRDLRDQEIHEDHEPKYRVIHRPDEYQNPVYTERERPRYEQRPASPPILIRAADSYSRVIVREEAPTNLDRPRRYRDEPEIEYRVRRDPPVLAYDGQDIRDHRLANARSYHLDRHESSFPPAQATPHRESRYLPAEDAAAQQSHIHDVVAKISQKAQQVRDKQPIKEEAGSEDGELRTPPPLNPENGRSKEYTEASNAAEQFLDTLQVADSAEIVSKVERPGRRQDLPPRESWENARIEETSQRRYDLQTEPRHQRDQYAEDRRVSRGRPVGPVNDASTQNGYVERATLPRESRAYAYDDDYHVSSVPEHAAARERSPELVDRRYKLNNVVYRDERQSSHGAHRTPSRYARYESARLENDRERSRSPVYVKMGPQSAQYQERSPGVQPLHQEPIYRTRTPQAPTEEIAYERAPPRQEYYRVYADESRSRPQYVDAFEYVQVSDPNGDYVIRRPVRREREPDPVYARYEDERYDRQPVYEARDTRAPTSRPEPPSYEEYDPRNPGPPPSEATPVRREIRYQ